MADQARPFLKQARGKSAEDRTFFEKLAVNIYGTGEIKPDLVLDEKYQGIVEKLPLDVQEDVDIYKNIFRDTPEVLENYLDEYSLEGFSDYIEKGKFRDDLEISSDDQGRFNDYNYLGKGMYSASYIKGEIGKEARTKIKESIPGQIAIGPTIGVATAIRGTSELLASLSDLYLDTEILDNVERALGDVDINKIYEGDAGTLARFTSVLAQYGTGFGVVQKITKKIAGKAIKTKLAEKAAKKLALSEGKKNIAKFGGYYALPAGIGDAVVSTTSQKSLGDIFGKDDGNIAQNILYSSSLEDIEGLSGKEKAAAILRNKLKFGAEGTAFMGSLKLIGPAAKGTAKTAGFLLSNVADPALTVAAKVVDASRVGRGLNLIGKSFDKLTTKMGVPPQEQWKFMELYGQGIKSTIFRTLDEATSRLKSGGKFDVQTRNELKKIDGLNRSAKKDFDIFSRALDKDMYKLVNAGFNDILFNKATAQRAMTYWDDVLEYLRGNIKLSQLPQSLRENSKIIRKLIDNQQEKLLPIIKDMKIKDDTIKNMGKYFKINYEIFKNSKFRAPKEDYNTAINYFVDLYKKVGVKNLNPIVLKKDATRAVNKILEIGRTEGTTPNERLKAIVNLMEGEKIPKNTFKNFYTKEKSLPDEIATLLGRVDDPKSIILDTIAEQAFVVNNYNAYKEIADFGLGKFLFRSEKEFQDFLIKNNIPGNRLLAPIKLNKPYNINFDDLFTTRLPNGKRTPLLALPEMAKAMKDSTVFMDTILKIPMFKSMLAAKTAFQMNKTVLSLMTQMRNITTAAMFATANGHIGAGASVSDNFKYLFDDLIGKTKNPRELQKLLKEASDNGAIDSSTIAQELQLMIPELMGSSKLGAKTVFEGTTSDGIFNYLFTNKGALGKVVQKSIESYQMGDNLWKLFGYNYTKSQLKPALKSIQDVKTYFREIEGYEFRPKRADGSVKTLDEAIQEIAGIQVRDVYPNYSMIPSFVVNVRKFPLIGNFVAFVSEMYRNSFQIARRSIREMNSSNPYFRQIGARRFIGFTTTVGLAIPTFKKIGSVATEIPEEVLQAYKERFAAPYEKGHTMVPVRPQDPEKKSWSSTDMSTLVPYADVSTPFKSAVSEFQKGGNTDQNTLERFGASLVEFLGKTAEPFLKLSIFAETMDELRSGLPGVGTGKVGEFRDKNGSLITDWNNEPNEWWGKLTYHFYKKFTPTTIRSGEEIAQAIGEDVSKSAIKRDLFDTVIKVVTGFGIRDQDPRRGFRFNMGKYSRQIGDAEGVFSRNINDARGIQKDIRLVERGQKPTYFKNQFEQIQKNKYRIMSEIYKDIKALRVIGFKDSEIIDLMSGKRATSKDDISSLMIGVFNPKKPPKFRKESAIVKNVQEINRELGTNYTLNDFLDFEALTDIAIKYSQIPLGLTESEREEFLRTSPEGKQKRIIEPAIEKMIKEQRSEAPVPQTPLANIPMPEIAPVSVANLNPTTGLTPTETALLSPEEQVITQRGRGILSL